jgi:hypothetical protein
MDAGTIFDHLQANGFDTYFPAQHEGKCVAPYVVVKDNGTSKLTDISSTITYYTLWCYVPKEVFSTLEPFVKSVKEEMKLLEPAVMPTYFETPSFYDDTVEAHMISVQYRNNKKL